MKPGQPVPDSPATTREAELRLAMLRHWYGDRLSTEQWQAVREGIVAEVIEVADALAAVKLDHTDEPLPLFAPYRGDD